MSSRTEYANAGVSLRAPRIAVVVPEHAWELHAKRAIEFFSRTWGGRGNVIVPVTNTGAVQPAVARLLYRFDPDYVTTLRTSVGDMETISPGFDVVVDGKKLTGDARTSFLALAESTGPQLFMNAVTDGVVDAIASTLTCFADNDGHRRIFAVHPAEEPPSELAQAPIDPLNQVRLGTGDQMADLALAVLRGLPDEPVDTMDLADGTLTHREAAALLALDGSVGIGAPFDSTTVGLSQISSGWLQREALVLVLGRSANDMALSMLWNRMVGNATWLPFNGSHKRWHAWLGGSLDLQRLHERNLVVTSTSWSAEQCDAFMRRLWAARPILDPAETSQPWEFVAPDELDSNGRLEWRLDERWDERFALPVEVDGEGAEMVTNFPLLTPESFPECPRGWIVSAEWFGHPVLRHNAVRDQHLVASSQPAHETFVRAAGRGIAFESGRFDFVASGASKAGRLAQPKLRWPGLISTLRIVAESHGYAVQLSDPGRLGRVAASLWSGRDQLTNDLAATDTFRKLVQAFTSSAKSNGPIDKGRTFDDRERRLRITGTVVVPFGALKRAVNGAMTTTEIRDWLDGLVESGAIRMGLALECGLCGWPSFYRVDEVTRRFECKRCGSSEPVNRARWRSPDDDPRWYYSLHPSIVQFLDNNTDIPLLAVRQFERERRADDPVFEIEFVKLGETKPTMEVDFESPRVSWRLGYLEPAPVGTGV